MRIAQNSKSVPAEDVACIDLVFNVLQAVIKAVGDYCFALRLEGFEVITTLLPKKVVPSSNVGS